MGTLNRKYFSDRICLLNLLLCFFVSIRYIETRLQGRSARNKTVCRRAVSKDAPISTKPVFPMPRMLMNTISHIYRYLSLEYRYTDSISPPPEDKKIHFHRICPTPCVSTCCNMLIISTPSATNDFGLKNISI